MLRGKWVLLAFVFVVTALLGAPAKAEGYYWQADQPDESMCWDATRNWVLCDSMGADGISSGGTSGKECKRSACWYCGWNAGKTFCGQTSKQVDSQMGCECGSDSNGECDLKGTSCSIG